MQRAGGGGGGGGGFESGSDSDSDSDEGEHLDVEDTEAEHLEVEDAEGEHLDGMDTEGEHLDGGMDTEGEHFEYNRMMTYWTANMPTTVMAITISMSIPAMGGERGASAQLIPKGITIFQSSIVAPGLCRWDLNNSKHACKTIAYLYLYLLFPK